MVTASRQEATITTSITHEHTGL